MRSDIPHVAVPLACCARSASTSLCSAERSAKISLAPTRGLRFVSGCELCDEKDPPDARLVLSILVRKYSPLLLGTPGERTGASKLFPLDARPRGGGGGGAYPFLPTDSMLVRDGERSDSRWEEVLTGGGGGGAATVALGDNNAFGDVNGAEVEGARIDPSLRDGGGGGALLLLTLEECGLPVSWLVSDPSSTRGDSLPELLRVSFESDTSWLCLLESGGAGGVFRLNDCGGDGDSGSGVFPAASLSKIDSPRSESWLVRDGAGGKGLFKSRGVGDGLEGNDERCDSLECEDVGRVSESSSLPWSLSSSLMSFPCLWLGGAGFFFNVATLSVSLSLSSSEISWDVRGDSGCGSCIGSNMDCRDIDEVSVLPPDGPALPVSNRRLKASTSSDGFPTPTPSGGFEAVFSAALPECSNVSKVFEKGFDGARAIGCAVISSSDGSDIEVSKGSAGNRRASNV
jgi:hypothetical protein